MTAGRKESEWERRKRRNLERAEHVATHGPACQLCGTVPRRGLDQDHDHRTGVTRGWLCHSCNRKLWRGVTPGWLRAAADYLERSSSSSPAATIVPREQMAAWLEATPWTPEQKAELRRRWGLPEPSS